MRTLVRRLIALALAGVVIVANSVACAGWSVSADARMACCTDGNTCPMHSQSETGAARVVTQTQADSCCASAERQQSGASAPTFIAALPAALVGASVTVPDPAPSLVLSNAWRALDPVPIGPVPRHVLLSVFLV